MKKAQIKIQQMAFMLLAVALFFALAGMFFLSLKVINLQKDFKLQEEERAINKVNKLARTSEFGYSKMRKKCINCVDADKLMVLKQRQEYMEFWELESVVVKKIYPVQNNVECTSETYPNCTTIKVLSKKNVAPISTYVSLCRKESFEGVIYDKCEIAILMIGIKNKTII